jgi:hypothetical protein
MSQNGMHKTVTFTGTHAQRLQVRMLRGYKHGCGQQRYLHTSDQSKIKHVNLHQLIIRPSFYLCKDLNLRLFHLRKKCVIT